uniref:Apple domain-containing protein n=1 Tax=Caenorhabditis tropicalis TaxID=1561998 RepID=A0A1I7UWK8_9PELO
MKTLLSLILLLTFVGLAESLVMQTGHQYYMRSNVQPIFDEVITVSFWPSAQCADICNKNPKCVVGYFLVKTNRCRLWPLVPNLDMIPYPGATSNGPRDVFFMARVDGWTRDIALTTHHLGNKKFRYYVSTNLLQVREVK